MQKAKRAVDVAILSALLAAVPLGAQVWSVGNQMMTLNFAQTDADFGAALAVGDINGDSIDDFVVGAPNFDDDGTYNLGLWRTYFGSTSRTFSSSLETVLIGPATQQAGRGLAAGDFDNDGRDEVAIGAPGRTINYGGTDRIDAGAVFVMEYEGGDLILTTMLSQSDTDSFTVPEFNDYFGYALETGNFNGDEYEDLAVGVPFEAWGPTLSVGVVHIFYGSALGLSKNGITNILSASREEGDALGAIMASGDFNGDGYDDLALGMPGRNSGGLFDTGVVEVYSGSESGLSTFSPQVLTDASFAGVVEQNDRFGSGLAAGNFNQSDFLCFILGSTCYDDLAIGVPGQQVVYAHAGKVRVAHGSSTGLSTESGTTLTEVALFAPYGADDYFGAPLAAGHLDRSFFSIEDLVVGAPSKDGMPGHTGDGVLFTVFGSGLGINGDGGAQMIRQEPGFAIAPAADGDGWGLVLAVGDFDHDGWGDLLVGVPAKQIGGHDNSGAVQVLWGALFADGFESADTLAW